ncbi:MAG: hypothetical protein ACM3US_14050 [Sphingomonadaceae bacterium]
MREEEIEGVHIERTGHKKMEHAYDLSDMEVVYRRGDWHNWDEIIHWLETQGERDNELTPGEVIAMVEDLRMVRDSGAAFTKDPRKAYELVFEHGVRAEPKR